MASRVVRIGGVAGLVVLVLLGAWFYRFYFSGPDAAVRRAEAFRFRRMTVSRSVEPDRYKFSFASNRARVAGAEVTVDAFLNEREPGLRFGRFEAKIEPSLGLGMLLDRTAWFQNEEIQLSSLEDLDRAAFVSTMREMVEASSHRALLIVVNGFRETFSTALRKSVFVAHVLDVDVPILVFDWPGDQGSSLSGYRRAREVADASGPELADLVRIVVREIDPDRVWLLANSLAGEVVAAAFGLLAADADFADAEAEIDELILTAPDIGHDEFDARFRAEMEAIARQLTVYVSSNDRALLVSRLINRERRRGESTLSTDQLDEAFSFSEWVEPDDGSVTLVDVTPVNRTRNFHNFSLETPEFFDDLFLRLTNDPTPRSRLIYPVRSDNGDVYWVLTRGR